MEQQFIKNNYEIVENTEKADIYVINTCTVTNMAERKSRQMLRRVKEINPSAVLVVCGCYAQVAKNELEKIDKNNINVYATKQEIPEIVEKLVQNKIKVYKVCEQDISLETAFLKKTGGNVIE